MNSKLDPYVIELESKIQILDVENVMLSAKAEENLLLNRAFEEINDYDDIDNLFLSSLESISVLLNIQFSGLFDLIDKQFICKSSYALFSNEESLDIQLKVPETIFKRLILKEVCVLNKTDAGFIFDYPNSDFVAESAIIIPIKSEIVKSRFFVFIDDISGQELTERILLLEKINRIISAKLERIYYQNELINLNAELEKKINIRTEELQKQNAELLSERLRAEKSEMQARDILQTALDGFWMVNMDGRFIDVNEIACKMLGYTREEMLEMRIPDIDVIESAEQVKERIDKITKNGEDRFESKHRCKDGKIIDVEVSVKLQFAQNLMVTFVSDITERKQSEEKVKNSEEKFRLLIQNSPSVIELYDIDGLQIAVNKAYEDLWGFPASTTVGKFNLLKSKEVESTGLLEYVKKAYAGEAVNVPEYEFDPTGASEAKGKGRIRWLRTRIYPLKDIVGNVNDIVITHEDITNQKLVELKLIDALKKTTESDRLKTAFLNNISHEIRTPLNGILGFAPIIAQPDISQEEKEQYLDILNTSGKRLMDTVTDYMDISLIVSDSIITNFKTIDINLFLSGINIAFEQTCRSKNLELKIQKPQLDKLFIYTDEELLRKIVSHLVGNAIKFTTNGSVTIGYENSDEKLLLYVKDTGVGIAADAQNLIFKNFMQANISNTRGYEGSGLGLSIAKGFSQLINGDLYLESEENLGTTLFLSLPLEVRCLPEQVNVNSEKNTERKLPFLLVAEDDDLNYLFIKTILKGSISAILRAENGREAVDLCSQHPEISLVLMDIKMPGMDGMEATRIIKSLRKDLPIIAVTAFAQSGDKNTFMEAGCDDYISKPFEKAQLIKLLNAYSFI